MPDQPGEQPPLPVAEDKQKMADEIEPAESRLNASADGGELSTLPKPGQPRSQLRAAIRAVYRAPRVVAEPEPEQPSAPQEEETAAAPPEQFSIPTEDEKVPISLESAAELTEPEEFLPAEPASSWPPVEETAPEAPAPHQEEMEKAARAQALIAKAQVQARQGHLDMARMLFGQAVQQDPTNAEAWTWLGGLLTEINLERAKICLTRAVELDATNERANRGLAQVNSRLEAQQTQERAIVLARPEIKIGLEEIIDRQRQNGIEADPESIPLGGARLRPAIERGELKPYRTKRSRLGPWGIILGVGLLAVIVGGLIWLGPLSKPNSAASPTALAANTAVAGLNGQPVTGGATISADETFALKMRLEIDKYNGFFLTARDLRQQIQHNQILWEDYQKSAKQLQLDIKTEKKPLDNLSLVATPKLIQYYRELQTIAGITSQAIDFTISGIDNTSPEDLEEGNRQFNDAALHLTELLRLLNQQVPLATPLPGASAAPISGTPAGTVLTAPSNPVTITVTDPIFTIEASPAQTTTATGTTSPAIPENLAPTPTP